VVWVGGCLVRAAVLCCIGREMRKTAMRREYLPTIESIHPSINHFLNQSEIVNSATTALAGFLSFAIFLHLALALALTLLVV
jgi:hypothetical protein